MPTEKAHEKTKQMDKTLKQNTPKIKPPANTPGHDASSPAGKAGKADK